MKRILIFLSIFIILLFIITITFISGICIQVSKEASHLIDKGAIERITFSESPVFYDDNTTPIGVFFDKTHSTYIEYKDVPKIYVKALVASEDGNFFKHPGFEVKAMLRAFIANLKAGRVVQGGSTITQQTAKNIFKREKRTYKAKFKEFIQALLIERNFTKEEILEMYLNQFFVTGFGKGLMIASVYFFDKDARDLDLVESAFIAGMVKGPDRYNPFTKKREEEKIRAMILAKSRKDYVLKNMFALGFITEAQYLEARDREVPFKEGKVTFRLNVIMDYIRNQMESDYFTEILHKQGIDNIATSGLKIYTSINEEIQYRAHQGIIRELPYLDIQISGYNPESFEKKYFENLGRVYSEPTEDFPFFVRIKDINKDKHNPFITVQWDDNETGIIDYNGMQRTGDAWLKWKLGGWALFDKQHVEDFLMNFKIDDTVPVRIADTKDERDESPGKRLFLCSIPELEGGIIVLKKGMLKAMVGGFFNRYFNRAVDAKRQLGSIFKPIVYTAALQLNWNILDPLKNRRDLYMFENSFYLPNPDHEPQTDEVSMIWAGTKSENLATVWLLYHLTDNLNMAEFRQVVKRLGLGRMEDESYIEYARRIRDIHGVVVNQNAILEAAFDLSRKDTESDLIFNDQADALDNLRNLHFEVNIQNLKLTDEHQIQISRFDFKRLRSMNHLMIKNFDEVNQLIDLTETSRDSKTKDLMDNALRCFYRIDDKDTGYRIIYSEKIDQTGVPNPTRLLWEDIENGVIKVSPDDIWIDNIIPSGTVNMVQAGMNTHQRDLMEYKRYDLELLSKIRDFRTLVNLHYVKRLAEDLGVATHLDPVLSFPLGSNAISIMEAALSYDTMINGFTYAISGKRNPDMIPIIKKIIDREGEIIWEYKSRPENLLSRYVSGSISEILRMVMVNGTGSKAKDGVKLSFEFNQKKLEIPVPVFGKTGTANRYTNSSFVGFIPGIDKDTGEFDIYEGYTIAAYVGYDNNDPMKGKYISIYGASGALPLWIQTSNGITNSKEYKNDLQVADLVFDAISFPRLYYNKEIKPIAISSFSGLPLSGSEDIETELIKIYADYEKHGNQLDLKRVFEPVSGLPDGRKQ